MSINRVKNSGIKSKQPLENKSSWIRNPEWLPMPEVLPTEHKMVILAAVFDTEVEYYGLVGGVPNGQFYTVDWGDGIVETNYGYLSTATHKYNFATLPESSLTSGGYKQAIITVTPNSGEWAASIINQCFPMAQLPTALVPTGTTNIPNNALDVIYSGPGRVLSLYPTLRRPMLESFVMLSGKIDGSTGKFQNCFSLQNVSKLDLTWNGSSNLQCAQMFLNCYMLEYIPELVGTEYAVSYTQMFSTCRNLIRIEKFKIKSGTNCANMFNGCGALESVGDFEFDGVTTVSGLFANCGKLTDLTNCRFNLANCTDITNMFTNCLALKAVPPLNTSVLTTTVGSSGASGLFYGCSALEKVPVFDISGTTSLASMFSNCYSLKELPNFTSTSHIVNYSNIFNNCVSLMSFPNYDFSAVTGGVSGFGLYNTFGGAGFQTVEMAVPAAVTALTGTFPTQNLKKFRVTGIRYAISLAQSALPSSEYEIVFDNLRPVTSAQTLSIGGIIPNAVSYTSRPTTVGSYTIPMASTTGLTVGMQVTGVGTPLTTPIAVTLTDATDLVTLTSHGLQAGDEISFATVVSTTGIVLNTIYYVINPTTDTFQIASSIGGSTLPLTTNGTGTIRYRTEIASIVSNSSITLTRKCTSTGTNTLSFRLLRTGTALLKGWTISG